MLCSRIAIIDQGKIVAIGDKTEFLKDGRSLEQVYLNLTRKENHGHETVTNAM